MPPETSSGRGHNRASHSISYGGTRAFGDISGEYRSHSINPQVIRDKRSLREGNRPKFSVHEARRCRSTRGKRALIFPIRDLPGLFRVLRYGLRSESRAGGGNLWLVFLCPFDEGGERWQEGSTERSEAVTHRRGCSGGDLAPDQAVAFEMAQGLGQHAAGDVGHGAGERVEAQGTVGQRDEDQHRPFVPQPVEHVAHRAALAVGGQRQWRVQLRGDLNGIVAVTS